MSGSASSKIDELIVAINAIKPIKNKVFVVAISGFGGSGKSSLAKKIKSKLRGAEIVTIDDFIIGPREQRSKNWATFDRERLKNEILQPARPFRDIQYMQFGSGEWFSNLPGKLRTIKLKEFLIVEGCGILHPSLINFYDYSIWIDCPIEIANTRAKKRDKVQGNNNDKLWDEFWSPNDLDYFYTYRPDKLATTKIKL